MVQYAIAAKLQEEITGMVKDPVLENYLVSKCTAAATADNADFKASCDPTWSKTLAIECDKAQINSNSVSADFTTRCIPFVIAEKKALKKWLVQQTTAPLDSPLLDATDKEEIKRDRFVNDLQIKLLKA